MLGRGHALLFFCAVGSLLSAQSLGAPAGLRPAHRQPNASILPGGRVIMPIGEIHVTGPGPFGLAVASQGRTVITGNTGPGKNSLTILDQEKSGKWNVNQWNLRSGPPEFEEKAGDKEDGEDGLGSRRGVFMGIAPAGDHAA